MTKKRKMKIRKSLKDRFKITKTGKVIHYQSFGSHLKSAKSKSRLRRLRRPKQLEGKIAKKVKKILGK